MKTVNAYILMAGLILGVFLYFPSFAQENWSPEHVFYGSGGKLSYTPDELGNTILDFSHVGYQYGDDSIPDIQVKVEVAPVDGDDGASIQAAIDSVSAMELDSNGFRGAVLIKKGTYEVSGQLKISASGVVLRGEGQTDTGTVIIASGTETRDLIRVDNGSDRVINNSSKVSIAESYVPVGRKFVVVSNASAFKEGDHIAIYRPGTQNWISDIKMDQITPGADIVQWKTSTYSFYFERLVTAVSGDTIFFRNPVVMAMETQYGGGSVYKASFNRLQNVGVEDLCLKSAYQSATDEDHSWKAIAFRSAEHGWVRNVTSWYFAYSCVSLERDSRLITVMNSHCREPKSIITGGRRYSFNLVGSLNLFTGCTTTEGRHDFVTSSRVCGPNVFTRCTASNTHSDSGPHHRWAMGTLYDLIVSDGEINVQDRDDSGTGHGWAGANQVFWNCSGSSSVCQSPWTSALNYSFGFQGSKSAGRKSGRPDGEWIGHNRKGLFPVSLYEAQLDARMNDTQVFSASSELKQLDDSTFVMEFNMPVKASTVITENFDVSGTAGLGENHYTISMEDEYSVRLVISEIDTLEIFSTIILKASNLLSNTDESLTGVNIAIFTELGLLPIVSGQAILVDNETGVLRASSNKIGVIYLVKYGLSYNTIHDLDSAVNNNLGKMVDSPVPGRSVLIYTNGLSGGRYRYYAVDEDGNISLVSEEWPQIQETGPVAIHSPNSSHLNFVVWYAEGKICIHPLNHTGRYSLQFFDITGRLLDTKENLTGVQQIAFRNHGGIIIIRSTSSAGIKTKKIMIR